MDNQELLFASTIIRRAVQMRSGQRATFFSNNPDASKSDWEKDNPDRKFLIEAFNEAKDVAELLRTLQDPEKT